MMQSLSPRPMSQSAQNADLTELRAILAKAAPLLSADRCRHETNEFSALWLFDGDSQVGYASRDGVSWRCGHMHRGTGTSCRTFATLGDCVRHILDMAKHWSR